MIQRWQSLLLLIATVMMALFSFCTLGSMQGATQSVAFDSFGIYAEPGGAMLQGTVYTGILGILAMLLALVSIFMFKATRLQRRVCWLVIFFILTACVCEWVAVTRFELPGSDGVHFSGIAFAPFIALAAVIVAMRCIRSDEKKLAGYDRLR